MAFLLFSWSGFPECIKDQFLALLILSTTCLFSISLISAFFSMMSILSLGLISCVFF